MRIVVALGLAVLLAACASVPAGNYEGVQADASGGGQQYVRVTLKPDGFAAVSSAFTGRPSRFLAEGTWVEEGRRVRLELEKQSLVFERRGDQLVAREWDRSVWGEAGPGVLQRVF